MRAAEARQQRTRPEVKARRHADWLRVNYNVTPEWYAAKLVEQGGVCQVCSREDPTGRLSVDHDHRCCPGPKSCGRCVRDLLCRSCNLGLGGFDDSVDRMLAAVAYVRRWRR